MSARSAHVNRQVHAGEMDDTAVEAALAEDANCPRPVRVALVDDEIGMHQLLRRIFSKYSPRWTLDSYADGRKALVQIPKFPPNIVLMDISMPGISGIECTHGLKTQIPNVPIVFISGHIDAEMFLSLMMAGASGCLCKPVSAAEIALALKKTMAGSLTLCSKAEQAMKEYFSSLNTGYDSWRLSGRERDVLICLQQGKKDKEIADKLGITAATIHGHTARIFQKMNVHSRAEAIERVNNTKRNIKFPS